MGRPYGGKTLRALRITTARERERKRQTSLNLYKASLGAKGLDYGSRKKFNSIFIYKFLLQPYNRAARGEGSGRSGVCTLPGAGGWGNNFELVLSF